MEQGWTSFQRGAFEQAIVSWMEAARVYERVGKTSEHTEVLTRLTLAYQAIGQYKEGLKSL